MGRRAGVAAVSGSVLAFAFPEPGLWWLSWLAIAPFLAAGRAAGARKGAVIGAAFGIGFFGVLLSWISIIGYLGWILLVLLQTVFAAGFGAAWGYLSARAVGPVTRIVGAAALWVLFVETLRAVIPLRGFPWGQLAQSQYATPWSLSLASVGGSWLVAWVIVAFDAALSEAATARRGPVRAGCLVAAAALALAPILVPATPEGTGSLRVAVVQGNIPRDMEPSYEKNRIILDDHVRLTRTITDDVDVVVWPESAVGIDPFRDAEVEAAIADAARSVDTPMIIGGNLDRDDDRYQVMAFLVSPEGEIVDSYQKTHLVPFGEFVPARRFLDFIPALDQVPRDAVPGSEVRLFEVAGTKIGIAISFEADFGPLVRERVAAGAEVMVVATNTSTWRESWASAQHVAMSQVRAAENGVPLVHGALTGISAFIEPDGSVVQSSGLWEPEVLIGDVAIAGGPSLYARTGEWAAWLALVVALGAVVIAWRRGDTVTG